jgi:hypothetical protein
LSAFGKTPAKREGRHLTRPRAKGHELTLLLLILALAIPALLLAALIWFARLLAATETPQDVVGQGANARSLSWLGRLRVWLTATPKRLDYRRDKRGRFRRVRRG